MAYPMQGRTADGESVFVQVDAQGRIVVTGIGGGGGGGDGADRELVVSTYRCKAAFTGASVGDTITATQIIDVTGTPTHVSTIWRNQTTAANLAEAPSAANLELTGSNALTDAQLRAAAVPTNPNVTRGSGVVDSGTQRVTLATDGPGVAALGTPADAAAAADGTGNYSIIGGIKRGLLNWATLLARIPALVSGRIPVDGSGVTQPMSVTSLPLPTGAATDGTLQAVRERLPATQITPGLLSVDTLAALGTMRVQNTTAAAASIVLTPTTRRISVTATQPCILSVSTTATVPASGATLANAIAIQAGETKDFDVLASTTLSVIRLGTTDGTVYVTELV